MKIQSFRDIKVWQKAHELTLLIYKMSYELPEYEKFELVQQIRRASSSVPTNIVEGFKRDTVQAKSRFYNVAQASLEETKYQLILIHDLGYLDTSNLLESAEEVGKMLMAFKTSIKKSNNSNSCQLKAYSCQLITFNLQSHEHNNLS